MPNGDKHFMVGAATGLTVYALERKKLGLPLTLGETIPYLIGGGIVGCLPDLLEPASHPNHRQFFHSIAFASGLSLYLDTLLKDYRYDQSQKILAKALIAAYSSHLFLDGATPKTLPII